MKHSWLKSRFETWITKIDVLGVCLFNLSYLITNMAYLFSQPTPNVQIKQFVLHWTIYRLFVLNTGWKRDSLQMMNIRKCLLAMKHGSTKNAFWDVNKKWRIWCKFVFPFLINKSYVLIVCAMDTKCPNELFYVWLFDLQIICAK
jgi:hypothetical protein